VADGITVLDGGGEGFFAEDVNPGLCGSNDEFSVEGVGGSDIDRIDLATLDDVFEMVVIPVHGQAILSTQGAALGGIPRNEGDEFTIGSGSLECG
jgi:hypothetical protein